LLDRVHALQNEFKPIYEDWKYNIF
jgi:hypothetical protein